MTTIGSAVVAGVAVLFAGSLPWGAVLAPLNLRIGVGVPWAALPMAAYLWAYWKFIRGDWGARENAHTRRQYLRANALPGDVWPAALLAGLIGFGALLAFIAVMARLVTLPESAPLITPAGMPSATAFVLLAMASMVAGVTEEAAFRGYMQTPIEQRYGLPLAILVNGTMFGLLHFPNHPDDVLTMLPYYIAVATVYSGLTWAANSILPSLVVHAWRRRLVAGAPVDDRPARMAAVNHVTFTDLGNGRRRRLRVRARSACPALNPDGSRVRRVRRLRLGTPNHEPNDQPRTQHSEPNDEHEPGSENTEV